jgi:SpoVK/Ycf46/Vps4 family AAA+-type ATPase
VLLDGPPGTGKTMAAHAIAHAVGRPVLQVDVPSVLSRWLGETEQRLAELFRRARSLDAVLLFDEADSFFAKRTTEVRGANDRYANVEVNTVLQLLEAHEGLVVLTTNLAEALDPAVRRRLRYRLTLEAPGVSERARLWERNLPDGAPLGGDIDVDALAGRFQLTGAHVANAALRAAASAASRGTVITQRHLEDAARAECRALGILCRED